MVELQDTIHHVLTDAPLEEPLSVDRTGIALTLCAIEQYSSSSDTLIKRGQIDLRARHEAGSILRECEQAIRCVVEEVGVGPRLERDLVDILLSIKAWESCKFEDEDAYDKARSRVDHLT